MVTLKGHFRRLVCIFCRVGLPTIY